MNPYVQKKTNTSHSLGMKLPSKTINELKVEKGKFNQNRRIVPSRTPDRLFLNDYSINRTPSIKRISDRVSQPGFQHINSNMPPVKKIYAEKNRLSEKRLIDKSYHNILHTESSKNDRSLSNPRPNKRTNSNNSKVPESVLGRELRQLQPISNNRLQNLNAIDKLSLDVMSNRATLKVPSSDLAYHSSLTNTRKNSLTQVNVNSTVSPTDMVSTTFVTSVGSGGGAAAFLTDLTLDSDASKTNTNGNSKHKIVLRPLLESRIQDQKLLKAYQMPKNYLLGAVQSSSQKFAGYRRARMQNQNYKDNNLSFRNKDEHSYNLSNSRSKENRKRVDISVDHVSMLDHNQITNRTAKSEKKMLSKRNSFTNMSLLDAVKPAFENNLSNNSFSIDEAFDRLNELTLKNRSARNDLLKIQESIVEIKVHKRKMKSDLSSQQLSKERSQPEF